VIRASIVLFPALLRATASQAADQELSRCQRLESPDERLACYDAAAGSREPPADAAPSSPGVSWLTHAWKLRPEDAGVRQLADILAYRPSYVIARWTSRPNVTPRSPATGRSSIADRDRTEVKIQGSFKTELISRAAFDHTGVSQALGHIGLDSVRLWFAYTQKVEWQALNRGQSRPISDANYEPELILTLGTGKSGNGFKLVNLGLSHESNGLDPREHRGWSRAYAQGGWDWERFSLLARLWHVVPQSDDDNPNIRRYMGSGDLVPRYQSEGGYVTYAVLRANLSSHKGYTEINWATPVLKRFGGLKFHAQLTTGYGETLIDYNHHQTTVGVGVSFGDW
jgi:phospholipase A1